MKGIDRDLLGMSLGALRKAYEELSYMKCDMAIGAVGSGKSDTYGLDWIPESIIRHEVDDYDANIVLVTEETGKMYRGEQNMEPTQTVLVCDPTDKSIKLREFLMNRMSEDPNCSSREVHKILKENYNIWEKEMGNPHISGASASITAIRDRRVMFNAMVNYVTGNAFVANSLGTKYGKIHDDFAKFEDVRFSSETKKGKKFAAFLGKEGYRENLQQCQLGLDENDCVDPWTGGPLRIVYLSSLNNEGNVSFIMSNGEKIGEWIGWLPWAKYARDTAQSDEHVLEVYRVFFENPRTKELVLVAPAPHYSIFVVEDGETRINLERMFQLDDPSHYRETLLIIPRHNMEAIGRATALGKYHQELRL